ncbi:Pyridine nucleotide-disulphide oxidoreductase [Anaerovirgula multivorans]|uniref:Pyridine nucleotide-disulphide oxidoreductase n=1 Tax=Anaerovirgula multivorans TaxID=312168 RepID=A0A239H894_9FIRM|nr:FAD-dependent oxidoreductase [Anaerovirgula multivorans]SNS77597.1 Pyridine nucleotide-disulphide oxidoreductase [Anaerovirgula multivorans]
MKYLILGASAAGISCGKTLRELDPNGEITVVSADNRIYSRCMLHHMMGGEKSVEELNFAGDDFFSRYNISWIKETRVQKLKVGEKTVQLENGNILSYDKLLIATGAHAFIPPISNLREGKGVYPLRNLEDALAITERVKKVKDVLVLGAGLVGIDAVMGLIKHGLHVTVVEVGDRILPMQLDKLAASNYEKLLKMKGVTFYTGIGLQEVELDEENWVKAVKLQEGRRINCEMIIAATGIRPNIDFIEKDTIKMDRGILINDRCMTNVKDVYGAGDVCSTSPIWPIAVKQGTVAAYNMTGTEKRLEDSFGLKNSLNFLELQTVSLGLTEAPDDSFTVMLQHYKNNYKKVICKDGVIYGAILQGDISYCGVLTYLIKNKINISHIDKDIFDIEYSDFFKMKENGEYEYTV